jgi:hypothetical protein
MLSSQYSQFRLFLIASTLAMSPCSLLWAPADGSEPNVCGFVIQIRKEQYINIFNLQGHVPAFIASFSTSFILFYLNTVRPQMALNPMYVGAVIGRAGCNVKAIFTEVQAWPVFSSRFLSIFRHFLKRRVPGSVFSV